MRNKKGQFIKGHKTWNKGKSRSKEVKEKISKANKGKNLGNKFGSANKGRSLTKEHKKKISQALKGKIKSLEHRKRLSKALQGEKNWNWKGGISKEYDRIRHSLQYYIWQQEVWKKDNWTCRLCGNKRNIIAHHIQLFSKFPELRFSIDNGLTVCRSCHNKIHKIHKFKK